MPSRRPSSRPSIRWPGHGSSCSTRGPSSPAAIGPSRDAGSDGEPDEAWVAEQKAGTILVALDGTSPRPRPCLMRVAGARDTESWTGVPRHPHRTARRGRGRPRCGHRPRGAGDLAGDDPACPRATISRRSCASGPSPTASPHGSGPRHRYRWPGRCPGPASARSAGTSTPSTRRCSAALRGPEAWAAFGALVERHVPPDRLALRGWMTTNEPLIRRGMGGQPPGIPSCPARRVPSRAPSGSGWHRSPDGRVAGRTPGGSTSCWPS